MYKRQAKDRQKDHSPLTGPPSLASAHCPPVWGHWGQPGGLQHTILRSVITPLGHVAASTSHWVTCTNCWVTYHTAGPHCDQTAGSKLERCYISNQTLGLHKLFGRVAHTARSIIKLLGHTAQTAGSIIKLLGELSNCWVIQHKLPGQLSNCWVIQHKLLGQLSNC